MKERCFYSVGVLRAEEVDISDQHIYMDECNIATSLKVLYLHGS